MGFDLGFAKFRQHANLWPTKQARFIKIYIWDLDASQVSKTALVSGFFSMITLNFSSSLYKYPMEL